MCERHPVRVLHFLTVSSMSNHSYVFRRFPKSLPTRMSECPNLAGAVCDPGRGLSKRAE